MLKGVCWEGRDEDALAITDKSQNFILSLFIYALLRLNTD